MRKRYAARARASIQNLPKILARTWGHRGATPSGYAFMSDILFAATHDYCSESPILWSDVRFC